MALLRRENGFTMIEIALVIILIGVALGIISVSYANSRKSLALTSSNTEVEALMKRAYAITYNEGVDVYLAFWDAAGAHPNRSAIYRGYPTGVNEWTADTPTEPPPTGVSADEDITGTYFWFKLANGQASVQSTVTLLFRREGSLVTVTSVAGGMSVTTVVDGQTSTVSINDRGDVID